MQECVIANCGELKEGEQDGVESDGDELPDFPQDLPKTDVVEVLKAADTIKGLGNDYVKKQDWNNALRKYAKVHAQYLLQRFAEVMRRFVTWIQWSAVPRTSSASR